ncbi:hypothetical protein Tco_0726113 [Tanacetum coccineum]|uniref:Uncharacterized protein n=1 Tax=Tanacetum coccineum TaxID=301880 RepID=A0ABQ4YFK4_9ASTR
MRMTRPVTPGPFDGDKVIPKNQVVVVVGESDTRNTTQPPQYLHKDGYTKNGMVGWLYSIKTFGSSECCQKSR